MIRRMFSSGQENPNDRLKARGGGRERPLLTRSPMAVTLYRPRPTPQVYRRSLIRSMICDIPDAHCAGRYRAPDVCYSNDALSRSAHVDLERQTSAAAPWVDNCKIVLEYLHQLGRTNIIEYLHTSRGKGRRGHSGVRAIPMVIVNWRRTYASIGTEAGVLPRRWTGISLHDGERRRFAGVPRSVCDRAGG